MTSDARSPTPDVRRVLLLSHTTGYQLRAFNDAADALGIELVFATDRCHRLDDPWQDRAVPVRFYDLDTSLDLIVQRAREFPLQGIIAVGDRPVRLAARAADALGLRWHSVDGAHASTDKRHSRSALAVAGLPSPVFFSISASDPPARLRPPYPVVLKPAGLSGSRGVIRANDDVEFAAAFERIRGLLTRPEVRAARAGLEDEILVEQYVDGREYAVEGVVTNGRLQMLAMFDKPDPLEGPFFEETIYVTPSRADAATQARIVDGVERAAGVLGLGHGPIHAECRVTPSGEIYVLEVAARPIGGLCSRVLAFDTGTSLESVLLQHAIGRPIAELSLEPHAAAVMMIPIPRRGVFKGVDGEKPAREVPGVTDIRITAKEGQLLEPLPEAGSYLGFIFAQGDTPEDAERAVRQAHERLEFTIAPEISLVARPT